MNQEYIFYKNRPIICDDFYAQFGWQENFEKGTVDTGYIMGYKDVADIIIEQYKNIALIDAYIFPVIFCYRQYLELVMKNVIYKNETEEEAIKTVKHCSHNLLKIWDECEKYLPYNSNEKDEILKVIEAFANADSSSMNYRYVYDKQKQQQIQGDLFIKLNELQKAIDRVDDYFYVTYNY